MPNVWESVFGGDNQVGFFGGGQRQLDPNSYALPGYSQTTSQNQSLAMRALGLQPGQQGPAAPAIGLNPFAISRMSPEERAQWESGVTQATQSHQAAANPMQGATQVAQPQDAWRSQQDRLAQSMFGTLSGESPSVAQEQLKQTTQGNVANAYAMAAASGNPAAARMAANNAANINQQAAGQGALLRAQETQNTQGMLGGLLGGARGQDISNFATQNQVAQGYLGQNLQAQQAQLQARIAQEQQAGQNFSGAQQNALGGKILSAAGNVAGAFVNPLSALGSGGGGGGAPSMAYGGKVPGYAMGGDSPRNDTVLAMLSPGEVVLPRSVVNDEEAPEKARAFLEAIRAKRMKRAA